MHFYLYFYLGVIFAYSFSGVFARRDTGKRNGEGLAFPWDVGTPKENDTGADFWFLFSRDLYPIL